MATLLSDNFDRANNASVVGAPQIGPTPTVPLGTAGIQTNLLYAAASPANVIWNLGTADVEISALFSLFTASNTVGILLGYVSSTSYWLVTVNTTSGINLWKAESGGTWTVQSANNSIAVNTGSIVKVHYKDSIIRVYLEGVQVIRFYVDVPITATSHGIRFSNTPPRVDNILAIDAPTIAEPTKTGDLLTGLEFDGDELYADPGFTYLGRDTKFQDAAAGA